MVSSAWRNVTLLEACFCDLVLYYFTHLGLAYPQVARCPLKFNVNYRVTRLTASSPEVCLTIIRSLTRDFSPSYKLRVNVFVLRWYVAQACTSAIPTYARDPSSSLDF